jgi:hypothetical protein
MTLEVISAGGVRLHGSALKKVDAKSPRHNDFGGAYLRVSADSFPVARGRERGGEVPRPARPPFRARYPHFAGWLRRIEQLSGYEPTYLPPWK